MIQPALPQPDNQLPVETGEWQPSPSTKTLGDTLVDRGDAHPDLHFVLREETSTQQSPWPAIPGYKLLGVLGRGGMGVVYLAQQLGLNRKVAIKMVQSDEADATHRARFRLEAEAVAQLHHPNIVQIYEIGVVQDQPYFSLEYVSGGSYSKLLQGKPQPANEAAALVKTLAIALQTAHQAGIIHRDLKPANILLTEAGVPKIADFGLAKYANQRSGQTQSGSILGTPSYMAPEQAAAMNDEIGPAADVYALGAILYEALTGRVPFRGFTIYETIHQVLTQDPVAPSILTPSLSKDLETICLKCLQKEPAKRYASAQALADDLERFLNNEPIHARPIGMAGRLWRWCRRKPALAAALAITITTLLAGIGISSYLAYIANQAATEATNNLKIADEQTQLAMKTLETVIFDMQSKLAGFPNAQKVRGDLLKTALSGLDSLSERLRVQQRVDRNTAYATLQLAEAFQSLGKETGNALQNNTQQLYERSVGIFETLEGDSRTEQARTDLANACLLFSVYLTHREDWGWEVSEEQANKQKERPMMKRALALSQQAVRLRDELLKMTREKSQQYELGKALAEGAYLKMRMNFKEEARTDLEQACQLLKPLQSEAEHSARNQAMYAKAAERLGDWHFDIKGDFKTAEKYYQDVLTTYTALAKLKPDDVETQMNYANAWSRVADARFEQGDKQGALSDYRQEMAITKKLEQYAATNTTLLLDCTASYNHLSKVLLSMEQYREALVVLKQAFDLTKAAIVLDPAFRRAHTQLGRMILRTGTAHNKLKEPQRAIEVYQEALQLLNTFDPNKTDENIQKDVQRIEQALAKSKDAMKK